MVDTGERGFYKAQLQENGNRVMKIDPPDVASLIDKHSRLVTHIAREFKGGAEWDDLIAAGKIGLGVAAKRYNRAKGAFSTIAYPWIRKYMHQAVKERQELEFSQKHGVPLNADIGDDDDGTVADLIPDKGAVTPAELVARRHLWELVMRVIIDAKLDKREKKIIAQLYGLDGEEPKKQKQIAEEHGLSTRRIRQIKTTAMEKIISVLFRSPEIHSNAPPLAWEASFWL